MEVTMALVTFKAFRQRGDINMRDGKYTFTIEWIQEFPDHQAACDGVVANHREVVPHGELFWTRPNWTAVNKGEPRGSYG
jgi:hypothetical protein